MWTWFTSLGGWDQGFLVVALVSSLFFIWQFIGALVGLGEAGGDMDMPEADIAGDGLDVDTDIDAGGIQILSIRAVVAFLTMGGWAGFLHHHVAGSTVGTSVILALAWGLAGGVVVAVLLYWLSRMTETPKKDLAACVGQEASVYMDIPARGYGKVRTTVSGAVSFVRARHAADEALPGGTQVRIVKLVDPTTVEVERAANPAKETNA